MLEDEIFAKKRLCEERLEPFGFSKVEEGVYRYLAPLMDDAFEARLEVTSAGQVSGQVFDKAMDEPYLPLRVARETSTYAGQVRQAYQKLLETIADACFEDQLFGSPQANRLAAYLATTYGDAYDFPFAKYPNYVSYRVAGKWYALLFPLKIAKLRVDDAQNSQRQVEVVNLKVDPADIATLLKREGIYPSYHMSKKTWVSVTLDDQLADKELFTLLDKSRQLVAPKHFTSGPAYWLIPANPKLYDIDSEFAKSQMIDWHQKGSIKVGDFVAIYITAPIKSLRYFCQVAAVSPKKDPTDRTESAGMRLQLLATLADGDYDLDFLRQKGVKSVRSARRMTKALQACFENLQADD